MKRIAAFIVGLLICGAAYAAPAPITIPNIATLIAGNFSSYPTVQVLGYYSAGDGGGGTFNWQPASTATTDVCVTFQSGGLSTGRFVRNLGTSPLSILQCGVKADGSTNNTTALQAAFNAISTYNLGEIYCPSSTGIIKFTGSITPIGGGTFRGQNNTLNPSFGSITNNAPGACHLQHTGTGIAFDYQTAVQSAVPCPSGPAPKWYNFTLDETSTGNSFRINNTSTAGFTDDCVGGGGGQTVVTGAVFDGIVLHSDARSTTAIEVNKGFDTTITNSYFIGYDTQIDAEGSDNFLVWNNKFNFATLRAVSMQSHGTFGNFDTLRDNTFFAVYTNATDFVSSSARSGVIDSNYFEADFDGITSVLNISCAGLNQTITNNAIEAGPPQVQYWLKVTGDCTSLRIENNYNGGGAVAPANWNAGIGTHWFANATKQTIIGSGNPDVLVGFPYITQQRLPWTTQGPDAGAGAVLGIFDASSPDSISGDFAGGIRIGPTDAPGAFNFTPQNPGAGHITFNFNPVVRATIDLWVYAATNGASLQQFTCTDGVGSGTITLTLTTTPAWYKVTSNHAVNNPTIDCANNDTTHNQNVYVTKWAAIQH